jgi:hypothetical protein
MCSSEAGRVAEIGRAIDDLAAQARAARGAGQPDEQRRIAARLAELWSMIAELDPEVARRVPTYRLD